MLDPDDVGRIVAVFDWEMSALGDPLVDLGIVLGVLVADRAAEQRDALTTVTTAGLFHARTRSSSATRRGPAAMCRTSATTRFSRVFKIAVVIQQIYYRYVQGQTSDRAVRQLRRARRVIWRATPRDLPRSPETLAPAKLSSLFSLKSQGNAEP